MCSPAESSAGDLRLICAPICHWMRWRWRSGPVTSDWMILFITPIAEVRADSIGRGNTFLEGGRCGAGKGSCGADGGASAGAVGGTAAGQPRVGAAALRAEE